LSFELCHLGFVCHLDFDIWNLANTTERNGIISMLTEMDIFSKMLIQSDTLPLNDEEETSYRQALQEHEKGQTVNWEDL